MNRQERSEKAKKARELAADLATKGVVAVAVTWVDTSGVTRVKAIPVQRLEHAAIWGIGASPTFDVLLIDGSIVAGKYVDGPAGDLRLLPDLDHVIVLAAQPGWAWAPADRYDQEGVAHPGDPRILARGVVNQLAALGYSARIAFEVEWWVSIGESDEFRPPLSGPAYGMIRLTQLSDYLGDLLKMLASQGISVDQLHPEDGQGQYEISFAAQDPVRAADTLVVVCQTIRALSRNYGLRASFAPMMTVGGEGNGRHVHLSLWRDNTNVMAGGPGHYGLTGVGEAFIGGILARLPALLAIGAPSVVSYLRLIPSHWAGAFACWGLENREAALRFITGELGRRAEAANLEVKCFDAAANPYLVVAGLLAAGMAGLSENATLPEPISVDPGSLDPDELTTMGISALPSSLAETLAAFESDSASALHKAFGKELVDAIIAVRRGEVALFDGATDQEIIERTRWKY